MSGRTTHGQTHKATYEQFRQEKPNSSPPDIILVQNCGFHEFAENNNQDGDKRWTEGWAGLGSLLVPDALVVFTSFNETEAVADLATFRRVCGKEIVVLVAGEENPMRSMRPLRDPETDIVFQNHFISVVQLA